jgi:hypothetical protein
MNSSSNSPHTPTDHPRLRTARNALIWFAVIVLAVLPFPWW